MNTTFNIVKHENKTPINHKKSEKTEKYADKSGYRENMTESELIQWIGEGGKKAEKERKRLGLTEEEYFDKITKDLNKEFEKIGIHSEEELMDWIIESEKESWGARRENNV